MEILCTKDYDLFNLDLNRPRDRNRIDSIAEIMEVMGFLPAFPVIVNDEMLVKDGQHRVEAARATGCPVYYIIDNTIDVPDVAKLNATVGRWSAADFVSYAAKTGQEGAQWLVKFAETEGVPLSWLVRICVTHFAWGPKFSRGSFKGSTHPFAEAEKVRLAVLVRQWREICAFNEVLTDLGTFFTACVSMFHHPDYDHRQMLTRLNWQSTRLVRCPSVTEYKIVLNEIYNQNSHSRNKVNLIEVDKQARHRARKAA